MFRPKKYPNGPKSRWLGLDHIRRLQGDPLAILERFFDPGDRIEDTQRIEYLEVTTRAASKVRAGRARKATAAFVFAR